MNYPYPCTVIYDRYNGAYSCAKWTAWNLDFEEIPEAINNGDPECREFWINFNGVVGKGSTPTRAVKNLIEKVQNG